MDHTQYNIISIGNVGSKKGNYSISIYKAFRQGLTALDGFTHIQVLWWSHLIDDEENRKRVIYPKPYTKGPDRVGVFATRSPVRPNPVSLTAAQVISIDMESGIIELAYMDAEHGTPVIDIKPYHPSTERIKHAATPEWCSHWPQWYEDSGSFDWGSEMSFEE
ncbi:MAG: SAM-dependent methyltransferase [Desulfobacteraceae bacterium]|nr:SAM-dependent methyltransferase [Desulfobacteraceae bacterium]